MMSKKLLVLTFTIAAIVFFANPGRGQETPYRLTRTLEHDGRGKVKYLAWTPDGKYLISASRPSVNVWDASSWELERFRSVAYPDQSIHGLAASPDSQCYALAVYKDELLVVDIWSGQVVARPAPLYDGKGFFESLIWTTEGVISGGLDYGVPGSVGKVGINGSTGGSCGPLQVVPHTNAIDPNIRKRVTVLFSHRGRLYVGGIGSTHLLIYRLDREGYPLEQTVELPAATEGLTASPFGADAVLAHTLHERADGGRIIEAGPGGVRDVWNWAVGKAEDEVTYDEWAANAVYALASRADGAAVFATGTGILYELSGPNRAEVIYRHPQQTDLDVDFIAIAPHPTDPNIIAFAPGDGTIRILEK